MKITIHEEKNSHFTFHGEKKGRSRVTKIPFTTLIVYFNLRFWITFHKLLQFQRNSFKSILSNLLNYYFLLERWPCENMTPPFRLGAQHMYIISGFVIPQDWPLSPYIDWKRCTPKRRLENDRVNSSKQSCFCLIHWRLNQLTSQPDRLLSFQSVQTGNIINLLSFPSSKIAGINMENFELDEEALALVLGGSTLIIPEKWREKLRTSRRPLKGERVYMWQFVTFFMLKFLSDVFYLRKST